MSATRESIFEQIQDLRRQIEEGITKQEDVSGLQKQLDTLNEQFVKQLDDETSNKKIIKG